MPAGWVDSHIHVFERGYRRDRPNGAELADYDRLRSSYGISHALVVGFEGDPVLVGNNAHLAQVAAEHNWILPLRYVHPDQGLRPAEEIADAAWAGVSLYLLDDASLAAWSSWTADDWATLPERSVVSVNTTTDRLRAVATVAARIDHRILISHLATPPAPDGPGRVAAAVAPLVELATIPTVHVKLSGHWAMTAAGWSSSQLAISTQLLVEAFGPDRVHWGSDFSPCLEHHAFATATQPSGINDLPPEVASKIRGASLAAVLDL